MNTFTHILSISIRIQLDKNKQCAPYYLEVSVCGTEINSE